MTLTTKIYCSRLYECKHGSRCFDIMGVGGHDLFFNGNQTVCSNCLISVNKVPDMRIYQHEHELTTMH
jgi:hypothetical protein